MVSRLKDAAIDLGVAQIDRVRDVVSPRLARNIEHLPIVLQGPMRELTSGRPVSELTLDGIRTVGIGFLERIEAMLDSPVLDHQQEEANGGDDSGDEAELASVASAPSRLGLEGAVALQRSCRQRLRLVPRVLPLHKLRTFAVQLTRSASRSATLKITVLCMQDTASSVMKHLRLQDGRQLLDRVCTSEKTREQEQLVSTDRDRSAFTSLATYVLGEWLVGTLFGRAKSAEKSTAHSACSEASDEVALELVEVPQSNDRATADAESDDEGHRLPDAEPRSSATPAAVPSTRMRTQSIPASSSSSVPMEFRLIVKNSFIEVEEPPPSEMRRAYSWETMRNSHTRSLNCEPFTIFARPWEPPVASSTSVPGADEQASSSSSDVFVSQVPPVDAKISAASASSTVPATSTVACDVCASSRSSCPPDPASVPLPAPFAPGSASSTPLSAEAAVVGAGLAVAIGSATTEDEGRTTVMLRNVPTGYSREELLSILDAGGFQGRYDFVYLPVDFTRNIGLGYALICLASPFDAELLLRHFDGFTRWGAPEHGEHPCEASWSEPRQGLQEHIERYRNSPVMHKNVPDQYKPIIFINGVRAPFPAPTKAIRPPRIRHLKPS